MFIIIPLTIFIFVAIVFIATLTFFIILDVKDEKREFDRMDETDRKTKIE